MPRVLDNRGKSLYVQIEQFKIARKLKIMIGIRPCVSVDQGKIGDFASGIMITEA